MAAFLLLAAGILVGVIREQAALVMLCCLLLVAGLSSLAWSRRSTGNLSYRRSFDPPRIFPGERTEYIVEIENGKLLPLPWVRLDEHLPAALTPAQAVGVMISSDEGWQRRRTVSLGWRERLVLRQSFTATKRGEYMAGPTDVETGDPLGFFPTHLRIPESRALLVYPRVAALEPMLSTSRAPFGIAPARPPVMEDPIRFAGIRDYRAGDPMRWVDWKATARRMKLQTRVFAPTTLNNVIVALNVQTMAFTWQGYDVTRLEEAIGVAAALVRDALSTRQPVGLAANASGSGMEDFQVFLPPNRRPSQLEDTLAVLARLAPLPTMAFGTFLRRIAANFPYGASLMVVTAFLDAETAEDLALLAERGHGVSLVYLGDRLPVSVPAAVHVTCMPEVAFEPILTEPGRPGVTGVTLSHHPF
ncbi:MAG: hypothetical protein HW416_217 [Chloroflexi bacterium]|nr:hypothetical protein [Chloroflexota bacterium]